MNNKPTQEELDAGIQAALDIANEPAPSEPAPSTPPEPSQPQPSEPAPSEPAPSEPEKEPVVDYKQKFTESSRESQIRESALKKTNEAIEKAAEITDIAEEELTKEFPDWDVMSDTEKRLAKDSVIQRKRFELIHQASQEGKDIRAWNEKVDTFIDDPKTLTTNTDLEGRQDEFKVFATKPSRRGADFETLVSAFLFEVDKTKIKHTGQMMPTGTGGPNDVLKPKSDKISAEESATIRETDYAKYRQLLKDGKIEEVIV